MRYDLAVIGGGLVGAAIGWGAARTGAQVALLDEGDVAFRAARGNFGLVWVQGKGAGMPKYALWTQLSAKVWPDLHGALDASGGPEVALEQPGGFYFCLGDAELEARAKTIERMHNESGDIGTRIMHREELRQMMPLLGDDVTGASFCPMDGHANPLHLLRALNAGLVAAGGVYLAHHGVERIAPKEGGFRIECATESLDCARLVIAAGLGSHRLAPMVGLDMPVHPLKGQILVTERMKPFLHHPTHVIRQTREGSVMMGDSHEDAGFAAESTVPVMRDIARRNLRVFPGLGDATLVRAWAALRVMSPDGFPIYEQSRRHPGAFSAACHSGVTLAGVHALVLAPAIMQGMLPDMLQPFSSGRFHVSTH